MELIERLNEASYRLAKRILLGALIVAAFFLSLPLYGLLQDALYRYVLL